MAAKRKYDLKGNRDLVPDEIRAVVDTDKRTAEISFSSDIEGERGWYTEQLLHGEENVDLARLNSTGALLLHHDTRQQVGAIMNAWIDGGRGRALVKFSQSQAGTDAMNDVNDGISRGVSVGYNIDKYEEEERKGKVPLLRATRWTPLEISLVSIPFDTSVGTDRSLDTDLNVDELATDRTSANTTMAALLEPPVTPVTPPVIEFDHAAEEKRLRALTATVERNLTISGIGATHGHIPGMRDLVKKYLDDQTLSERAFCTDVLNLQETAQQGNDPAHVGMSTKEKREYSILRGLRVLTGQSKESCLEMEVDTQLRKQVVEGDTRANDGNPRLFIPSDIDMMAKRNERTLVTTSFASAGALSGDDFQAGSFIELLRNKMIGTGLGIRMLTGLTGNVVIPRQTGAGTASWVGETTAVTASDQTYGQITLSPKRLGALTNISRTMIAQSSLDVEALTRDDILTTIALKLDYTILQGSGAGAEPMGILNQAGIGGVTFGGAATWADIVEFITDVETGNVDSSTGQFVTSIATMGRWATILKDSVAGAGYLWELGTNTVAGRRAVASNQVANNIVYFGRWSDFIIGTWSAPSIMIDPLSLMEQSIVRIYAEGLFDMNIRYAPAFSVSTDSGAA